MFAVCHKPFEGKRMSN